MDCYLTNPEGKFYIVSDKDAITIDERSSVGEVKEIPLSECNYKSEYHPSGERKGFLFTGNAGRVIAACYYKNGVQAFSKLTLEENGDESIWFIDFSTFRASHSLGNPSEITITATADLP